MWRVFAVFVHVYQFEGLHHRRISHAIVEQLAAVVELGNQMSAAAVCEAVY